MTRLGHSSVHISGANQNFSVSLRSEIHQETDMFSHFQLFTNLAVKDRLEPKTQSNRDNSLPSKVFLTNSAISVPLHPLVPLFA